MIFYGDLPAIKVRSMTRIRAEDLRNYIQNQTGTSAPVRVLRPARVRTG